MQLAESHSRIAPLYSSAVPIHELEYIAFSGQHAVAHGIFRSLPKSARERYANKYILSGVISGGVVKLRAFLAASAEMAAHDEKMFIDETMSLFVHHAHHTQEFSRELFESLLLWGDELKQLSLLNESLRLHDEALAMGVNKFPDMYARCLLAKADVLNVQGKVRETQSLLASLAERSYIITDRNLIPELLRSLSKESLLRGEVASYKALLFQALRHFYTNIEQRRAFVDQIRLTYRREDKVMLDANVSIVDKLLYLMHRAYFIARRLRVTRFSGVSHVLRLVLLGTLYVLNYVVRYPHSIDERRNGTASSQRRNVLVTRAMGGIGDFLMMTPGLHALKQKFPNCEIHFAIPKRYFPLFQNNADVSLIDIDRGLIQPHEYKKWLNITDCPAARIESRTAPKVKQSRIELFARGFGLSRSEIRAMEKRPRYFLSPDEKALQARFWSENNLHGRPVVGIQLHSDEVYRDYPHMRQVASLLARSYDVLVFAVNPIAGYDEPGITKIEGLPMREAFALVSACDAIVAPDSAFVHLAAAFELPTVALYGPIDGKLRTKHYPNCVYLDVRQKLGCLPCWRNDKIPCALTNMRTSVCMADISVREIESAVHALVGKIGNDVQSGAVHRNNDLLCRRETIA